MYHRLEVMSLVLVLLLSLGLPVASAQRRVIQLCGITQFADALAIQAVDEGDQVLLILDSDWKQFVPNLYTLIGPGTIVPHPTILNQYNGTFFVGNNSEQFGANPNCVAHVTITDVNSKPPSFPGTAIETCRNGPGDPFQVTLNFVMRACREPAFPASADFSVSSLPNSLAVRDGHETRIPAGEAPNEYVAP